LLNKVFLTQDLKNNPEADCEVYWDSCLKTSFRMLNHY